MNLTLILGFENQKKVRVLFLNEQNKYKSKTKSIFKIYTTKGSYKGLKKGDFINNPTIDVKGVIDAVGLKKFIYTDKYSIPYKSRYPKQIETKKQ